MKTFIDNSIPKSLNLFKGKDKSEVWSEIRAKSRPVDKEKILAEMKQKLIIKKGQI
jgi:hypothetical protein